MSNKIESLTPEQLVDLTATYQKWLTIGRSTAPLDHAAATEAISKIYEALGKKRPSVLFFSSPIMCLSLRGVFKKFRSGEDLCFQLWGQFWEKLGDQLGYRFRDKLWNKLWNKLSEQLWDQLSEKLYIQLRRQLNYELPNHLAGQHWCAWEAFCDFCNRIGVKYTDKQRETLDLWICQAKTCHWWFPYEGVVLASERHSTLHVDEVGRLHCENGPAMGYSDGYRVWAWHGVLVSQEIIESPEAITADQIEHEQNSEIRRVLTERYGQARYLIDSGAHEIHQDDYGTLYRKEVPDDEALVMVKVVNSTAEPDGTFKDYFLRVPSDMKTARQAVAWTFGKEEKNYAPLIET